MPPAGFEPTVPGNKRLLTYAVDGAATGISEMENCGWIMTLFSCVYHTNTCRFGGNKVGKSEGEDQIPVMA
jgi:hypothetical protein